MELIVLSIRTLKIPTCAEYGGFTSWFYSSGRTRTAEAIRQQATLVVFALGGLVLLDAAANSLWNISNEGVCALR